jgi:hypothetical protein
MRSGDDDDAAGEVDGDAGFRARAVLAGDGGKIGGEEEGELRLEARELFRCGADEKLAGEKRMPGLLRDNADGQAEGGIGAAEAVLDEDLLRFKKRRSAGYTFCRSTVRASAG